MTSGRRQIGYCTNVHAGADLAATRANLATHALAVKRDFSPSTPMGIGLWLAAPAARRLLADGELDAFAAWLAEVGLLPFTLNGFPYGDFHEPVVKHRVYHPDWLTAEREDYTLDLVTILDRLLPPGIEGSISTLPLRWGQPPMSRGEFTQAATRLLRVARRLAEVEQTTGRLISLCLEPEPGCALERSDDLVKFFSDYLFVGADAAVARRYLRVCHDVCHAAVMFEPQADVLASYQRAGIHVGKVQISSAVRVAFDEVPAAERRAALDQLARFSEDRYLHQTMVRRRPDEPPTFYEDLPLALQSAAGAASPVGEWRVHFHVPVYLAQFGHLGTSQNDIFECLRSVEADKNLTHFEVETYAWGVLPSELRQPSLAAGIAAELHWFANQA